MTRWPTPKAERLSFGRRISEWIKTGELNALRGNPPGLGKRKTFRSWKDLAKPFKGCALEVEGHKQDCSEDNFCSLLEVIVKDRKAVERQERVAGPNNHKVKRSLRVENNRVFLFGQCLNCTPRIKKGRRIHLTPPACRNLNINCMIW